MLIGKALLLHFRTNLFFQDVEHTGQYIESYNRMYECAIHYLLRLRLNFSLSQSNMCTVFAVESSVIC
jgi:hypothetical protein